MAESVRVESLEPLTGLQAELWKFQAAVNAALSDADSELRRTLMWLELEQEPYWKDQITKREVTVARAKDALRMKTMFKDVSGRSPSAIEEQKALQLAQLRLTEAQQKLTQVHRWIPALQKEVQSYRGAAQHLASSVESLVPAGVLHLKRLIADIEAYAALAIAAETGGNSSVPPSVGVPSAGTMARGTPMEHVGAPAGVAENWTIPTADQRRNASVISELSWSGPALNADAITKLTALTEKEPDPDPQLKITIAPGVRVATFLCSTRLEPVFDQDSGWCIGAPTAAPERWESISLADWLRCNPDFKAVLKLPVGFSVILDKDGWLEISDPLGKRVGRDAK
jgi:hypothetical protein